MEFWIDSLYGVTVSGLSSTRNATSDVISYQMHMRALAGCVQRQEFDKTQHIFLNFLVAASKMIFGNKNPLPPPTYLGFW